MVENWTSVVTLLLLDGNFAIEYCNFTNDFSIAMSEVNGSFDTPQDTGLVARSRMRNYVQPCT